MDAGLLPSTETNDLTVGGVADRVALGVLEGDGGDGKIASSSLRKGTAILGGDDRGEALGGDLDVVAVLLEVDTVDGAGLSRSRSVLGVDLEDEILSTLLLLENLKGSILVSGSNYTVRNFLGDDGGCGNINDVAEGNNVTEAAHAVGTTGTGVSLGEARGLNSSDVVDEVNLALLVGQGKTNGGSSRGDMLEASSGGLAKSLLELLDQRPGVEGIKQVDVTRRSTEDLEGQLSIVGESSGGLLVRVGTVAQSHVLVAVASVLLAEVARDGTVIVGCVFESLEGVSVAAGLADFSRFKLLEESGVVVGVAEDSDTLVVLGSSTDQSDTTNVNLFDGLGDADVGLGNGVLEGIEVADNVVNLVDVLVGQILLIGLEVTGEDTGVDGGVQGLDTARQHLGRLGDGTDVSIEAKID